MLYKIVKLLGIILVGAALFASLPFTIYAYSATVSTGNVTNISPMNATLNGFVSTGGETANAWFEYGTDVSFGNSTTLDAFIFNTPYSGNYSTNISNLVANTTYYFRAVAQNADGRVYGNVGSFTTNFSTSGNNNLMSPTAITTSSSILAYNTVQLNALILTGNTQKTDTWFEWGATPNLGSQTVEIPLSGSPAIRHTNTLTGLASGTKYYFRAVAENSYGRSDGVILTLVTSGGVAPSSGSKSTDTTSKITSTDTTTVDKSVNTNTNTGLSSLLGASVFSSRTFLPVNLFGWLILIILILILILLSKHAHRQIFSKKNSTDSHDSH